MLYELTRYDFYPAHLPGRGELRGQDVGAEVESDPSHARDEAEEGVEGGRGDEGVDGAKGSDQDGADQDGVPPAQGVAQHPQDEGADQHAAHVRRVHEGFQIRRAARRDSTRTHADT